MPQYQAYNESSFTRFVHWLEQKLERHRLIDIPRGFYWHTYYLCSYGHIGCTCVLSVLSIFCFCTGIQNSFMYDEVNCSDGSSLTLPLVNMTVIYYALMAIRQQADYYAAFEHVIMSGVAFLINIFFTVNQLLMGMRWMEKQSRIDQNWPFYFATIDFLMFFLLLLIELANLGVVFIYILLLTDWVGWRQQAQLNVEQAAINRIN